jgi:hypothetical protein
LVSGLLKASLQRQKDCLEEEHQRVREEQHQLQPMRDKILHKWLKKKSWVLFLSQTSN